MYAEYSPFIEIHARTSVESDFFAFYLSEYSMQKYSDVQKVDRMCALHVSTKIRTLFLSN